MMNAMQGVGEALTPRRWVAGAVAFVGSWLLVGHLRETVVVAFPATGALIAAIAIHRDGFGPQLLARAAWWSNLLLGLFLSVVGGHSERVEGFWLMLGASLALLIVGHRGMVARRADGTVWASAYVTTLAVALVLALADTSSLVLWGVLYLGKWNKTGQGLVLLMCAAAMLVGAVGLYRARAWGLVVNAVTNVSIATLALSRVLDVRESLAWFLTATAVLQLLVPVPMLISRWRGAPIVTLRAWHRRRAMQLVVSVMTMIGAVYAWQ
jgi:hypothetical protein